MKPPPEKIDFSVDIAPYFHFQCLLILANYIHAIDLIRWLNWLENYRVNYRGGKITFNSFQNIHDI